MFSDIFMFEQWIFIVDIYKYFLIKFTEIMQAFGKSIYVQDLWMIVWLPKLFNL